MSVKSAPYYWLECDEPGCGAKSTESSEHTAWSDLDGAIGQAEGADWQVEDGHYCDIHWTTPTGEDDE